MQIMEKLGEKQAQAKNARTERKLEGAVGRGKDLEKENRLLRDQLDRTEDQQRNLERHMVRKSVRRPHRLRWLIIGGLVTWAAGTEDGRRRIGAMVDGVMEGDQSRNIRLRAEATAERIAQRAREATDRSR